MYDKEKIFQKLKVVVKVLSVRCEERRCRDSGESVIVGIVVGK